MVERAPPDAVAIVGLAGRFPGASDLDGFWRNIRDGVESLDTFSEAELEAAGVDAARRKLPAYVNKGTVLTDADCFDAEFFGFSPREAQTLDPQQRVFLECAWEALEQAGYAGHVAGQSVGVYAGVGMNTYLIHQILGNPAFIASVGSYQIMVGNDKDFLATRVSYKLDLRGPSITVQTACSTSLVAVALACRGLQRGECDMALAGGVSISFPQRGGYLYEEGMILSPDGHCRPFDAAARGTRAGSGAGIVVLKRLDEALAARDTIHAVIRGAAINNDGAGKAGYTAPSIDGQVEVIATAQALAGVDSRSIGYVEAHGTGTPLGDPIEIAALTRAFRASTADVGFCRIGSLKANLGHLDAAAGVAGLIKTVLALKHHELPPLLNFRTPNPQLDLARSPFVASDKAAPWDAIPRRAGVSSFGIGGTNAHVVVEEAAAAERTTSSRQAQLLVISARTPAALDRATERLRAELASPTCAPLSDIAFTLQVGRQAFAHRRAVVARDIGAAAAALAEPLRPPVLSGSAEGAARPVAFLFSGQGSQHPRMGMGLYEGEPAYRSAIDRCAEILRPYLDADLRDALSKAGDAEIADTRLTQPLLFSVEFALASLWMRRGITPSAMLGHSIGEYVAAHLSGVLSLEDALAVVAARGRLMGALPPGAMAAVHLPPHELGRWLSAGIEIAAVNGPSLCALAGPVAAIEALLERLAGARIDARALHTSHAFHSAMMDPVLEPFRAVLERVTLAPPRIPYLSNLSGTWISAEEATAPDYYVRHLRHTVRFEAGVRALAANPDTLLLEIGPGNALTSLARLTLGGNGARRTIASLAHPRDNRPDAEAMLEAAGRLWLGGARMDWQRLHEGDLPNRVPLPTYPFERTRHWVERGQDRASVGGGAAVPTATRVEEMFYAPTWQRDDAAAVEPRLSGKWLILAAPGQLGDAVVRRAREAGADAMPVAPGTRFDALRERAGAIEGAILLWNMPGVGDPVELGYHAPVALAAAFGDRPLKIIVATAGAESVLDEPVTHPQGALALGPVLALPGEVAGLRMRAVDIDPADADAAAASLVEEAARDDGELHAARRAGRRWVRRFERVPLAAVDPARSPLRREGVYLITGGLGGIGLKLARRLAADVQARLILTARRPPDVTAARHIADIETAGGQVLVATADASDESAMRRAVDAARVRWGRIDGVIHAAGVPGTGTLAFRKDAAEVAATLAPKVNGLATLVRVLGDQPLEFVALLSSISAVIGGPGLADYASGNAVLDAFVDAAHPAAWRHVLALNYAPWKEIGMAARITVPEQHRKLREAQLARTAVTPEAGAEAFFRVLSSGRRRVVVVPFDLQAAWEAVRQQGRARMFSSGHGAAGRLPAQAEHPARSSSLVGPMTSEEECIAGIWSELLGVERIGVQDDFFELGGHSLLATRVLARIEEQLGARLALRDIFEAPTIQLLATRLTAARRERTPAATVGVEREELEF